MKRLATFGSFVLGLAAAAVAMMVLHRLAVGALVRETVAAAAVVAAYLAGTRWLERGAVPEVARPLGGLDLAKGAALGAGLFAGVMLVLGLLGAYRVAGLTGGYRVGAGVWAALVTAVAEETLFRGLLFRALSATLGTWLALLVTAALFGAAHAFNPGATLTSSAAIALEAGILLGAAYAWTRRLWLPVGVHAGWNFAEATVFGVTESGAVQHAGLVTGHLRGADLLTGGAFGPEASVVAVVVCLVPAAWLLWRTARAGRVERPAWSRAGAAPGPAPSR